MGFMASDDPVAKGPVTYCLDELSVNQVNPTFYLSQLRNSLYAWTPASGGLEDVLEKYLLSIVYVDASKIKNAKDYLKAYWFGTTGTYFGDIAKLYATGLVKTLDLSLLDERDLPRAKPLPINFILDGRPLEGGVDQSCHLKPSYAAHCNPQAVGFVPRDHIQ